MRRQNHRPAHHVHQAVWPEAQFGLFRILLAVFFPKRLAVLVDHREAVLAGRHGVKKMQMILCVKLRGRFSEWQKGT